jgi:hypothetical protein
MRPPTLVRALLLVALAAPVASASTYACAPSTGLVTACAGDVHASAGSCETAGYAFGYDTVFVASPVEVAYVYAGHSCYTDATLQQEATVIDAGIYTPVVATQLDWADARQTTPGGTTAFCTMFVTVGTTLGWNSVTQPCVVPPPDPGWGHLLP